MRFTALSLMLFSLLLPPVVEARTNLAFPTAATTGALYPLGAGMANLWNDKIPDLAVRAQASNGGVQNLNLLLSGDAQISFAVSSIAYEAMHGMRGFTNRPYTNLRVLAGLYYNPNQVVVRADSGIASLADLKGRRFASGAAGSTTEVETRVHLTELGFAYPEDIKAQYVGFTEAIDLMRNRQLDGAWIMAGTPTAAVTEMCATADAKLLPLDAQLLEKIQARYPWYVPYTIPAGTYPGQTEPVKTSAVKLLLLVDASVPDALVYELTKTLWTHMPELAGVHPVLKGMTPDLAVKDLAELPLHPGSVQYYKEAGLL